MKNWNFQHFSHVFLKCMCMRILHSVLSAEYSLDTEKPQSRVPLHTNFFLKNNCFVIISFVWNLISVPTFWCCLLCYCALYVHVMVCTVKNVSESYERWARSRPFKVLRPSVARLRIYTWIYIYIFSLRERFLVPFRPLFVYELISCIKHHITENAILHTLINEEIRSIYLYYVP